MIDVDADAVHLALSPGVMNHRSDDHAEVLVAEVLDNESRLEDVLALKPLEPSMRRSASMVIVGQPLFALDGGIGVPHLAMTVGAFTDGSPEPAGNAPIFPDEAEEIRGWRAASGPVLGRDLDTTIVPLVSIKDGSEYGIAKLLHVERRGVHLRLYADRFDVPPDHLQPWTLRLERYDAPSLSYGHAPMSRRTFATMDPAYARLAMRTAEELDGYRMWQEANGGFL